MNKTELLQKTLYLLDRVDVPSEFSNLAELIEVELAKPEPKPHGYINVKRYPIMTDCNELQKDDYLAVYVKDQL